VIDQLQSERFA